MSHTTATADTHSPDNDSQHGHEDHRHHGGLGKYLAVFVALCVLTGASFFTYSPAWPFKDQPSVTWTFMMAVSCMKAALVIGFFMHLLTEANWKYVLTIPAAFMSLFLVLMLVPDIGCRTRYYSEERAREAAAPQTHHDATPTGERPHGGKDKAPD